MSTTFNIDLRKAVFGEASVEIERPIDEVFDFVGEGFFENYPKWALEVVDFEPLDGAAVQVGAKARQVRQDNGAPTESIFAITELQPNQCLVLSGLDAPYRQSYVLNAGEAKPTRLTFRFELLELDLFMRPFEKLIRYAIEEGAENTVDNIKNILTNHPSALCAQA